MLTSTKEAIISCHSNECDCLDCREYWNDKESPLIGDESPPPSNVYKFVPSEGGVQWTESQQVYSE